MSLLDSMKKSNIIVTKNSLIRIPNFINKIFFLSAIVEIYKALRYNIKGELQEIEQENQPMVGTVDKTSPM